jgi:hypothetical protein
VEAVEVEAAEAAEEAEADLPEDNHLLPWQ